MTLTGLPHFVTPGVISVVLHTLRLVPVTVLCPFLGGPLVPGMVRLAIALGLGTAAGLADAPISLDMVELPGTMVGELSLGCTIGVIASMPIQAARAGGRLADTLRGTTLSELHVPLIRQRETALGNLLAQWSVVLSTWAGGDRLIVRAILGTFEAFPIGQYPAASLRLELILSSSSELMACAFVLAAPSMAGVLAADLALSMATRIAPSIDMATTAQPARAALGLFAIVAASSALAGRLVSNVAMSAALIQTPVGAAP